MDKMQALNMKNIVCPKCGGPTVRGAVLSGGLSVQYFFEHAGERCALSGSLKPKAAVQVVSFACQQCGLVSSFLEGSIHDESKS